MDNWSAHQQFGDLHGWYGNGGGPLLLIKGTTWGDPPPCFRFCKKLYLNSTKHNAWWCVEIALVRLVDCAHPLPKSGSWEFYTAGFQSPKNTPLLSFCGCHTPCKPTTRTRACTRTETFRTRHDNSVRRGERLWGGGWGVAGSLIPRPTFFAQHGNAKTPRHGNANKQELTTKKTRKSTSMSHA